MLRTTISPTFSFSIAAAALLVVIVCLKLVYFERWLIDNDNYYLLGTFFSASAHPDYVKHARRYYEASAASCEPHDKDCIVYAGSVHAAQTYARPLNAFFGSLLSHPKWLGREIPLLDGIAKVTVAQAVASTTIGIIFLLFFLASLPRTVGAFIAGMTALFGLGSYLLPEHPALAKFQLLSGVDFGTGLLVLLLALAFWIYAGLAPQVFKTKIEVLSHPRTILFFGIAALAIFAARVIAGSWPEIYFSGPVLGSRAGILIFFIFIAGMGVFLAVITIAAVHGRFSRSAVWISIVILFGFFAAGEGNFTVDFHFAGRGYIYLLVAPVMVYVALRPNGWAILLLPALAVFHIAVAGLLAGCIFATELVESVRRRSVSVALFVSGPLLAAAIILTVLTSTNPIVSIRSAAEISILSQISILPFTPGLMVIGILLYAGYLAWQMPDPGATFFLRAIVLALILAVVCQVRLAIEVAGFASDPRVYFFVALPMYIRPIVCEAGIFLVVLGLIASSPSFDASDFKLAPQTTSLLAIGIFALMAARGDNSLGKPPNPFAALSQGLTLMTTQRQSSAIDSRVLEAASPDDRYLVGRPGDPTTMMSILKMKLRASAGLLNSENVRISTIPGGTR